MQLNEIQRTHKRKLRKRIGRGGKRGTYSGKGIKGQKARSNTHFQPFIRELIKRYPKLKGYRASTRYTPEATVSLKTLEKRFEAQATVNPQVLAERRIIRKIEGQIPQIKILSQGSLTKALTIESCLVSKGAREKIERAGGMVR